MDEKGILDYELEVIRVTESISNRVYTETLTRLYIYWRKSTPDKACVSNDQLWEFGCIEKISYTSNSLIDNFAMALLPADSTKFCSSKLELEKKEEKTSTLKIYKHNLMCQYTSIKIQLALYSKSYLRKDLVHRLCISLKFELRYI